MKRPTTHSKEKKDVNVNTLFPSSLLDKLDEWAWRNRMTRSAALRALVEMAFNGEKRSKTEMDRIVPPSPQAEPEPAAASDLQQDIRSMLSEHGRLQEQMRATLQKVERMQESQNVIIDSVSMHHEAIDDIKQSLKLLEMRMEKQQ